MPILKERKLSDTPVGECILAFGTWGEVCPVLAMALLLTTRTTWQTLLILALFAGLCVIVAVVPSRARKAGHTVYRFLAARRNTTSQTLVRVTVVMLIGLVTVSAVFDLDIVLGAFAAGFVLRYVIPEGDHELESKLEAIGYGFLIPVFFVVSGAKIDLAGVGVRPVLLVGFIVMLLLIRAVPIVVALSVGRGKNELSIHNRVTVALYCTTALPMHRGRDVAGHEGGRYEPRHRRRAGGGRRHHRASDAASSLADVPRGGREAHRGRAGNRAAPQRHPLHSARALGT